jgi:hypothetical protein
MCVDEAGQHGSSLQVDRSRQRAGQRLYCGVGADGHDSTAFDGESFGDGELLVDGDDLSGVKNEVGRRRSEAGG